MSLFQIKILNKWNKLKKIEREKEELDYLHKKCKENLLKLIMVKKNKNKHIWGYYFFV